MQARPIALKLACALALVVSACGKDESNDDQPSGGTGAGAGAAGEGATSGDGDGDGESGASGGAAGMAMSTGGMNGGMGGEAGINAAGAGGSGGSGGSDQPYPDPRGACDLDTGFVGDDACILPPAEGEGFQIHIGPEDYANPGPYVVAVSEENSLCVSFRTPNTEEVYYQTYVLSGRPGTHHIIDTMYVSTVEIAEGQFEMCLDGGAGFNSNIVDTLPGASRPYMPRKRVAPENIGNARKIPALAPAQADMHYFNFTDDELLREFWLNVYLIPASQVAAEAKPIRGMGGIGWQIAPSTDRVYQYQCKIPSAGRITSLLGHYHAHGVRFTAYLLKANGTQQKVFEMYDYNEPAEFSYDSLSMNPAFSATAAGALSGMLEVAADDVLQWECHIVNNSDETLDYSNKVRTGEMCNIWGNTIGDGRTNAPDIDCVHLGAQEQPFDVQ